MSGPSSNTRFLSGGPLMECRSFWIFFRTDQGGLPRPLAPSPSSRFADTRTDVDRRGRTRTDADGRANVGAFAPASASVRVRPHPSASVRPSAEAPPGQPRLYSGPGPVYGRYWDSGSVLMITSTNNNHESPVTYCAGTKVFG